MSNRSSIPPKIANCVANAALYELAGRMEALERDVEAWMEKHGRGCTCIFCTTLAPDKRRDIHRDLATVANVLGWIGSAATSATVEPDDDEAGTSDAPAASSADKSGRGMELKNVTSVMGLPIAPSAFKTFPAGTPAAKQHAKRLASFLPAVASSANQKLHRARDLMKLADETLLAWLTDGHGPDCECGFCEMLRVEDDEHTFRNDVIGMRYLLNTAMATCSAYFGSMDETADFIESKLDTLPASQPATPSAGVSQPASPAFAAIDHPHVAPVDDPSKRLPRGGWF